MKSSNGRFNGPVTETRPQIIRVEKGNVTFIILENECFLERTHYSFLTIES